MNSYSFLFQSHDMSRSALSLVNVIVFYVFTGINSYSINGCLHCVCAPNTLLHYTSCLWLESICLWSHGNSGIPFSSWVDSLFEHEHFWRSWWGGGGGGGGLTRETLNRPAEIHLGVNTVCGVLCTPTHPSRLWFIVFKQGCTVGT